MNYLLMFEGAERNAHEAQASQMLTKRLSEALSIPILEKWNAFLWEAGQQENLIVGLETGGDCQEEYLVQLTEAVWREVITRLLMERRIHISGN